MDAKSVARLGEEIVPREADQQREDEGAGGAEEQCADDDAAEHEKRHIVRPQPSRERQAE